MNGGDKLPEGWKVQPLGEVANTQLGKAINPRERGLSPQLPYLRNANVQWDEVLLDDIASMHFSEADAIRYRLTDGDLLVCEGGVVGRSAIWRDQIRPCYFQNALHRVRSKDESVSVEWLLENMRFLVAGGEVASRARGNTILHLSQDALRSLPVVIPPPQIAEAMLDVLAGVRGRRARARDRISAAGRAVGRFQQAVLAAGCSGRLTADVREGDDSAVQEFLASHAETSDAQVNKRRTKQAYGLSIPDWSDCFPSTWAYLRVRELVELRVILDLQDGNHGDLYPRRTDFADQGVPFISAESVWERVEIEAAPKLRSEVAARLRIGFAQPRDVILTHNATVGRVAILPDGAPPVVLSTSTTYYRTDERVLAPEYLLLFMRSHFFQEQLSAVMSQTTRNQVPVTKQVELAIAVPSPAEQRQIVERAGRLLSLSQELTARIETAAHRVDHLYEAVLAKAFRGDLMAASAEGE